VSDYQGGVDPEEWYGGPGLDLYQWAIILLIAGGGGLIVHLVASWLGYS
jgi:hypothetical protein